MLPQGVICKDANSSRLRPNYKLSLFYLTLLTHFSHSAVCLEDYKCQLLSEKEEIPIHPHEKDRQI